MKLLLSDDKIRLWAGEIADVTQAPVELNNPGALLWHGQFGAMPAQAMVVGQPRPLAKFNEIDNGWSALYRELTTFIQDHPRAKPSSIPFPFWNTALRRIVPDDYTGDIATFFKGEV